MSEAELARIRAAYEERDAGEQPGGLAYPDPAYIFYVQGLERALLDTIRTAGIDLASTRVLEVGCGTGAILHRFVDFGAKSTTGIDLSEQRIEVGRRRFPELSLLAGDAARLPFPDGSFELVLQLTCLSSVHDRALRAAIAEEMWRVLAPDGLIVSYDLRPTPRPIAALRRALRLAPPMTPVVPLDEAELSRLFPGAMVESRLVTLNVALSAIARRSRATASLLALVPWLRTHLLATACHPDLDRPA